MLVGLKQVIMISDSVYHKYVKQTPTDFKRALAIAALSLSKVGIGLSPSGSPYGYSNDIYYIHVGLYVFIFMETFIMCILVKYLS